jgi:predicted dehydrogenase
MTTENATGVSRRDALKVGGLATAATLAAGLPGLYAAESNTINIALVGCGGRGTGAAVNALSTRQGPIKLVAMADAYKDRLEGSFKAISSRAKLKPQIDVTEDRKFFGFDAYKQAIDALKPGDVVIMATPPAFRWVQFQYAIEKGINVFMEKPVTVDGPTSKKMFELGKKSKEKNLKVGVGLMCRHCDARGELFNRVKDGIIGDITLLRAYRMAGPTGNMPVPKKPEGMNDLEWQIRRFHGFLWASGGAYSDFLIHNIDECCWIKDAWPVEAKSNGGRHYREGWVDQNFDSYSTEFTFADGTKLFLEGRTIPGCHNEFASYAHGTKGLAVISESGHAPSHARAYKGHVQDQKNLVWEFGQDEPDPYQLEWEHLMQAIRQDKPYNEVERGVEASLVTSMGRMSAHTGQVIKRDQILNEGQEFAPDVDKLVLGGPAPIKADEKGVYPLPNPGKFKRLEYDDGTAKEKEGKGKGRAKKG